MNISTKTNNLALVGLTAKFLKVFGLGLVFWFVTTVCIMKLETLREINNAQTESQSIRKMFFILKWYANLVGIVKLHIK